MWISGYLRWRTLDWRIPRKIKYGAPITAVATPAGRITGNARAASKSASSTTIAPISAACGTGGMVPRATSQAACPLASATKASGPAITVAAMARSEAMASISTRSRPRCMPSAREVSESRASTSRWLRSSAAATSPSTITAAAVGKEILAKKPETTYSLVRFASEDTARLYATDSFIGEIMVDMGIPRPEDAPDTTESIFVPLSPEEILKADAEVIFQSTWAPEGAEGDASRAQEKKFTSNPLWKKLKGEVMPVDDSIFLSSVSLQGAGEVITQVAEHFEVDPQLP